MTTSPMSVVLQRLRTAFGQDGAGMTDGELLTLFLDGRDEAALATLVRRHSSMVWGVCCRLLRSHHDAEDAFQATFLVLVRKAASVKLREAVGNWLYGVAYQTAVRVRAMTAKRGGREKQVTDMPDPVVNEASNDDFLSLLDQELCRLPSKHRLLIVLGDLEGKTRKELAQQFGVTEGTVAGRLASAREMLAKRLAKRGVAMSGEALAASLSQSASTSASAPLVASTIQAANMLAEQAASAGLISTRVIALTEGVVRAMFVSKVKSVLAVILVVGVILGGLGVGHALLNPSDWMAQGGTNLSDAKIPRETGAVTPAEPQVFAGTIDLFPDGNKADSAIGRHGVLFIRSEARLNELNKRAPDLKPDKPLPKIDFTRHSIVLVYAVPGGINSRATSLTLGKSDFTANPPELGFSYGWYNGSAPGAALPCMKFIYAVIPATPEVKVTLTSSPIQEDGSPTHTEFSARLGKDGGDVVEVLQAAITPKATKISPGDDILIDFALHLADLGKAKPERFGTTPQSIFVWDGKYSKGYRNYAFFVTTPDGKTALLRPKVIDQWDKNAPHPVAITVKEPYHLPNWGDGDTLKSLKTLGLDTTTPGTYTITGLYEETVEFEAPKTPIWGGSIISNTITVEVKKGN